MTFNSASADTDYGTNDSLFLAVIKAEWKEVASISPKIARVHRASSEEEFFDAGSSFTVAWFMVHEEPRNGRWRTRCRDAGGYGRINSIVFKNHRENKD